MKICLVGKPKIVGPDGKPRPVPGQQSWAVLARLLQAKRPLSRRELASDVFPNTEDPLGALRWCLASLRRATGAETLQGDPIQLNLPEGTSVDVWNLSDAGCDAPDCGSFLEGVEPVASAEFSTWLMIEREHIAGKIYERLRRDSIKSLSVGDIDRALDLAMQAVKCRPLDESAHIILVKCLAASGSIASAVAHVDATEKEFLRETGERPSNALRAAARKTIADAPEGVPKGAVVDSLIKSGVAAVSAGAVDAGLDCLRRAAADAEALGDEHLAASALQELGSALVHAVRGFDDEGAIVLRRAADIAARIGSSKIAANALCEMGYIETMAGRRPSAAAYLGEAMTFIDDDAESQARVHAFTGFNLVDWGQVELGLLHFEQSLEFARSAGNRRREIWSLGIGAWGNICAGRPQVARDWLTNCLSLCDDTRWLAFRPWPVALLAETRLMLHEPGNAVQGDLEEALALSNQLGDPCWQAATARALGLVHIDTSGLDQADKWMRYARERCCSVTDLYAGLLVAILSSHVDLLQNAGRHRDAADVARDLLSIAAKTHADAHLELAAAAMKSGAPTVTDID
ncbi:BTAD domain-containing putative transcriptional regulator [Defluviimonas aestuarii]|uniref:BTAD domain-containing putative transcriptional regulator n=1 Tax=Albidovulum aestuarii TaxID=1130726 RepID=UPI00249A0144|nr:BTAD domain-containing putative transcriptional regulator [Defluviimonas aestuarii]MDI3335804.1 BTAD domain-containing putative transcriptional regulator [Defluviimonas aestuarii]